MARWRGTGRWWRMSQSNIYAIPFLVTAILFTVSFFIIHYRSKDGDNMLKWWSIITLPLGAVAVILSILMSC